MYICKRCFGVPDETPYHNSAVGIPSTSMKVDKPDISCQSDEL